MNGLGFLNPTGLYLEIGQDLLRALPDDAALTVDASGSKMTVRAGRSRFTLQTLPESDFPAGLPAWMHQ